jgi:hypothetical protein
MTNGTVVVQAKPWFKSLTIGFNLLAGGLVLADYATGQGFAFTSAPWFGAVVAAGNFALRFRTVRPVAASQKDVDVPRSAKGAAGG